MNTFWLIFLAWFLPGVGLALVLIYSSKWKLFFGGLALTLYGGLAAISTIADGRSLNFTEFEYAGHGLLLFYSVLGGSLLSSAINEIREDRKRAVDS